MITGKIVANAGSHRILAALQEQPRSTKELKNVVGAINSVARFEGEYMGRLEQAGYVHRIDGLWALTPEGSAKLAQVGPISARSPTVAGPRTYRTTGVYRPEQYQRPMRPGSQDFLKFPSRVGNRLYYRDGRVETLEQQ